MSEFPQNIDPAILRGLLSPRISRRHLLQAGAVAGAASILLPSVANAATGDAGWWAGKSKTGVLNFANWPYYIDSYNGRHPSLDNLKTTKGITTTYSEVIEDNPTFYQQIRPSLLAGDSIGYDIIVMTDNAIGLRYLLNGNYLIPLDDAALVNFKKNASTSAKAVYANSGKRLIPWQSGMTSLAYNSSKVSTNTKSLKMAFDTSSSNVAKLRNRVGMLSDPIELGNIALLALGKNPATSTEPDWHLAATKLRQQRDSHLVKAYYGNDIISELKNGNLWVGQVYSGDVFQARIGGNKNLKLMNPTEGVLLWTDNMCIPKGAEHPRDAMTAIDYFYDPAVAAVLAYYVNYITPVPGAKAKLTAPTAGWQATTMTNLKKDIGVAANLITAAPEVFPTAAYKLKSYYTFKNQGEITLWNDIFAGIPNGQ
jgi:spermidine/putrescine transport system substrate-binding protein